MAGWLARGTKVISQTRTRKTIARANMSDCGRHPGGRYLQRKMSGLQVKLRSAGGPVLGNADNVYLDVGQRVDRL